MRKKHIDISELFMAFVAKDEVANVKFVGMIIIIIQKIRIKPLQDILILFYNTKWSLKGSFRPCESSLTLCFHAV